MAKIIIDISSKLNGIDIMKASEESVKNAQDIMNHRVNGFGVASFKKLVNNDSRFTDTAETIIEDTKKDCKTFLKGMVYESEALKNACKEGSIDRMVNNAVNLAKIAVAPATIPDKTQKFLRENVCALRFDRYGLEAYMQTYRDICNIVTVLVLNTFASAHRINTYKNRLQSFDVVQYVDYSLLNGKRYELKTGLAEWFTLTANTSAEVVTGPTIATPTAMTDTTLYDAVQDMLAAG